MWRVRVSLVLGCLVALIAVTPAEANFVGQDTDPAGDSTDPSPGRDLVTVGLSYDRKTGTLAGGVELRGAPTDDAPSYISLAAGKRSPTGCDAYPAGVLGSYTDETDATWARLDGPGIPTTVRGRAEKRGRGEAVQSFQVETTVLADQAYDCVMATLSEPLNPANVYDTSTAVDLVGRPGLGVRVTGVPKKPVRPGKSRKLKVTITNTGDGPATAVKLRIRRARGVTIKPRSRALGTLAPGARTTVAVTVRLGRKAKASTDLSIAASTGGLTAEGVVTFRKREPRESGGGGGGGGGGAGTPSTCVQYSPDLSGESGGSLILVPCLR